VLTGGRLRYAAARQAGHDDGPRPGLTGPYPYLLAGCGDSHRFREEFETVYEPGELLAVAYTGGTETGRHLVRSAAGPVLLRAEADRQAITADGGDLAYVTLTLTDPAGTCCTHADRPVRVEVSGHGVLVTAE
jgi:beta-galactosidase